MKKTILFISILFVTALSYGQVNFAIKTGINIATTKNLITFPINRIGWYAGGKAEIAIYKKYFFQPELLLSSKGYRYKDLSDGKTVSMRLNYINAPILFGYEIDSKTNVVVGTELGYLAKAISHSNIISDRNSDAINSFPHRFDIGLAIGIAYNITKDIGAEVRYNYGLNGFYQTDVLGTRRSKYTAANRVFQLGIYYNIF